MLQVGVGLGQTQGAEGEVTLLVARVQAQRGAADGVAQDQPVQVLEAFHRLAIHREHRVARADAGLGGGRCGRRLAQHRFQDRRAGHEQAPEQQDGEQEIGQGSGRDDGGAGAQGLAVEGLVEGLGRHRGLALVQHLDVTAQGDGGQRPLGLVPVGAAGDDLAETHGKTQDLDAGQARHQVVAELVEDDEDGQGGQEGEQGGHAMRTAAAAMSSRAAWRAAASAASRSSRESAFSPASFCRT